MSDEVTRRLQALEDRNSILELMAAYCDALDRGLEPAFRDLWVVDGVWEFRPPLGRYEGVDRIMDAWREIQSQTSEMRHITTDTVVELLNDVSAVVRSTGFMQASGDEGPPAFMFLTFHDTLRRVEGQWRFAWRRVGYTGDPVVDVNEVLR